MARVNAVAGGGSYSGFSEFQPLGSLDNFLQLFLAQLQYQNPLEPVKDHEFIAQLAQFSNLEEVQQTNKYLANLSWQMHHQQALQLLGREVHVESNQGVFSGLVEAVTLFDNGLKLIVAGEKVELDQVLQIGLACGEEGSGKSE